MRAPGRDRLADAIDALLPQTQCRRCGYAGCRPYAEAIAAGECEINRCPPGGARGIAKLAALLERALLELDASCGGEKPLAAAFVDEAECIGCTACIDACPVDAIVGATRRMHTVLAALCTGCELCVPSCPVDCIGMVPAAEPEWNPERAAISRQRFEARNERLARLEAERETLLARGASFARSAGAAGT